MYLKDRDSHRIILINLEGKITELLPFIPCYFFLSPRTLIQQTLHFHSLFLSRTLKIFPIAVYMYTSIKFWITRSWKHRSRDLNLCMSSQFSHSLHCSLLIFGPHKPLSLHLCMFESGCQSATNVLEICLTVKDDCSGEMLSIYHKGFQRSKTERINLSSHSDAKCRSY